MLADNAILGMLSLVVAPLVQPWGTFQPFHAVAAKKIDTWTLTTPHPLRPTPC